MKNLMHFQCEKDNDHVLWLSFDRAGERVNTLDASVFDELEKIIECLSEDHVAGLVLTSGKSTGFIAGANIEQFVALDSDAGFNLIRRGQKLFSKIEALNIPTVALINGFCLGGGLELALAFDYRIALEDKKTRLGLPEVMLGIHPGWGGTLRLPRLIGALAAMPLILSGRIVDARKAKRLGIVDAVVPERQLAHAAHHFIIKQPPLHQPSWLGRVSNMSGVRTLMASLMTRQLKAKVNTTHYPAPQAAIDQWKTYGVSGEKSYKAEARSISQLFSTDTAQNLIRAFFLQTRMKAMDADKQFDVQHVHVIGAGTMGGDIAAWCAYKGLRVTLQDQTAEQIAPAMYRAKRFYQKKLKHPRLVREALDRLTPDVKGLGISRADVIIEAIFENLEAKQQLFKTLELKAKPDAVLATNTSSIPLDEMNTVLDKTSRLIGIHFFNPVAKMQLVEVVASEATAMSVQRKAVRFIRKLDRLPLPVKSSPGFLVNRVLMPYLMESVLMLGEGVSKAAIDKAAKQFGMPMGPVELADTVGLDVCLMVAENLTQHLGGVVPALLKEKVEEGKLGRKSGEGFYHYAGGKLKVSKVPARTNEEIQDRLIYRLLNESAACLREGIVSDADLLDAGMIFGTGFAPFRGGPMQYVQTVDQPRVLSRLNELAERYGERFKPDAYWL